MKNTGSTEEDGLVWEFSKVQGGGAYGGGMAGGKEHNKLFYLSYKAVHILSRSEAWQRIRT